MSLSCPFSSEVCFRWSNAGAQCQTCSIWKWKRNVFLKLIFIWQSIFTYMNIHVYLLRYRPANPSDNTQTCSLICTLIPPYAFHQLLQGIAMGTASWWVTKLFLSNASVKPIGHCHWCVSHVWCILRNESYTFWCPLKPTFHFRALKQSSRFCTRWQLFPNPLGCLLWYVFLSQFTYLLEVMLTINCLPGRRSFRLRVQCMCLDLCFLFMNFLSFGYLFDQLIVR